MTKYGRSPWVERYPRARVPTHPRLRAALETDVVIVGGGLTGCAVAYALAAAGIKVALVEAEQIGRGSSADAFGWIADAPDASFHTFSQSMGLRSARRAWQAWRRAALDFEALLRRLDVKCQLEPRQTVRIARTPEQTHRLKREAKARKEAGLDAVLANARSAQADTGTDASAALRTRDGAALDPYRATLGLAGAAVARGALLFERSLVKRIRSGTRSVEVVTADATVTASRVVVATGRPTGLFPSLVRHVKPQSTYCALTEPVPARIRRSLGSLEAITTDSVEPAHYVRWVDGERLLVAGADGPFLPDRARAKTLIQRTGQLMYELSTLYPDISGLAATHGWGVDYARTADGLPFLGSHRNFPRHLFAFAGGAHSITEAYLASRILLRHHLGESDDADEVFGFTRV